MEVDGTSNLVDQNVLPGVIPYHIQVRMYTHTHTHTHTVGGQNDKINPQRHSEDAISRTTGIGFTMAASACNAFFLKALLA